MDLWVETEFRNYVGNVNDSYALVIRVGNAGNRDARDVVVTLEVKGRISDVSAYAPPEGTWLEDKSGNPLSTKDYVGTLIWKIPRLDGQSHYDLGMSQSGRATRSQVGWLETTVTSATLESATRQQNNRHRLWETFSSGRTRYRSSPDYWVEVGVSDRNPVAGDTVNFTVKVRSDDLIANGCVNIRLTGGLTLPDGSTPTFTRKVSDTSLETAATGHSFATSTTRECGDKSGAAGFYLLPAHTADYESTMTLPVTVKGGFVVSEQCLTAEVFAIPPAGSLLGMDDGSDNRAQGCLRLAPLQVFDDGEVAAWTLHACKDSVAANGCDTADEVEVKVFAYEEEDDHGHGHSTAYHPYPNHTALIHVKDGPGRVFDAHADSVTGGTTVSWMTATDEHKNPTPKFANARTGVKVRWYRAPAVTNYSNNWVNINVTKSVAGLDGGNPPGKLSVRSSFSGTAFWPLTADNNYTYRRATNYNVTSTTAGLRNVEFENLGTYVLDFTAHVLHKNLTSATDGCRVAVGFTDKGCRFDGTGRTIFHVGPIADLGVQDGGASPDATADQVAFSVVASNHRDEVAPLGKVEVTLPAGARGLRTVPANTGVFHPNANPPKWTWDVGDLERGDNLDWTGGWADGQPVTLIVDRVPVGATATAEVTYDPYEVCIASDGTNAAASTEAGCDGITGASWHSGTVFDVDQTNDTATLTARRGLSGAASGRGVPTNPGVQTQTQTITTVTWDAVNYLYGFPVTNYEIQGLGSDWIMLDDKVAENEYQEVGAGRPAYRVRAVNLAGVKGPWSGIAGTGSSPPATPPPSPSPGTPSLGGPSFAAPGVAVTLYAGQWDVAALPQSAGGVGSISYSFSPALGNGVHYSPADHVLSSQSSTAAAGTAAYILTATDSATPTADTASVTVNVSVIPDVCGGTASTWRPTGVSYDAFTAWTVKEQAALIRDCNLLLSAKSALEGAGGTKTLNWSTTVPIDTWDYVRYQTSSNRSGYRRIDALVDTTAPSATKLKLGGVIPPQLDGLSALERLVLPDHGLTGSVPALTGLINVTEVDLSGNSLSGSLPAFHGLTGLTNLNLSDNSLTGSVPAWKDLTGLTHLNLSGNGLTGSIPASLGNLSKLVNLNLSGNGLTGSIPASLGNLSKLVRLDLSDNAFSGNIPHQLGNAVKLKYLWLNDNALTGGIPARTGDNSSSQSGLHNLADLLIHDGLRLYGNKLETAIDLAATPSGDLTEGGSARATTASITSIDEGTVWASRFEVFDPTRDGCGASPPPDSCYLVTKSWDGKVTATVGTGTGTPVPVTVSPGEIDLSILKDTAVPGFNSYVFTITPGSDTANTNTPGSVTIGVTGKGVPGVADTKAKFTSVTIQINDSGPSTPDFHNQVVELQHVTDDSTGCLDVPAAQPENGKQLQTWECNDTNAQKWRLVKRAAGDKTGEYKVVSQVGNEAYCLDNRGDFVTSARMGLWTCVDDSHGAVANQSVTITASGDGHTLTFTNNGASVWMSTDRADDTPQGGVGQTASSGTAPATAVWSIVTE